ncbi:CPBP family intramembrane glutamic endopeptidase [Pseudorhodoferax sp. Leaf267]|uniref:CPBP family intramembrane glutamic endopeptidase n=1 Tax=Pseudorhodoferax sp. Leaf267 TaxID=1736316 RepID=UPI00138F7CA5|nr:CPBP family intramembrane glutamic endopeptidase [Pseudorhodoferax sp. Leaf267]
MLYAAAVMAGLVEGVLLWPAVLAIVLLVAAAAWAVRVREAPGSWLATALVLALRAALVLHQVPGFHSPVSIDAVRFTPDALPFTQRLNFDKGSVGLVLLALLAPRLRRGDALGSLAATTAVAWLFTTCAVLGLATAMGVVQPDFKLPEQTRQFLLVNLLLTCVAEQALFRTLVQDPLRRTRAGPWGAAVLSALLFGAAHAAGGAPMVLLSALAGLGHAWVYERTRRIEAPILVHFGLNAAHFLGFTYPALALS